MNTAGTVPPTTDTTTIQHLIDGSNASGTSNRHVQALVENVAEKAKKAGHKPVGVEGEEGGECVLLDLQDALVHVMLPKVREFYNLEKLWSLGSSGDLAVTDW